MSHVNHSRSNQIIWHDGCPECDERAANLPASLGSLDGPNTIKAWHYMRAWRWSGGEWTADADQPSANDRKLYECLYSIGVFLERAGISPAFFEYQLIVKIDEQLKTMGMTPVDLTLNGINLTGIFVKGDQ